MAKFVVFKDENGNELHGKTCIAQCEGLQNELDNKQPKGDYATNEDLKAYQPKGDYATTEDLKAYQPKGDYLTEHQKIKTVNGQSLIGEGNIEITGSAVAPSYVGKVVSVLGDSISTYNGYNPVDERKPTYPSGDVNSWDKTWWGYIISKLGLTLGMNDSWSGSRVQNTYTDDLPASNVGPSVCMAGLKRIQNLSANGTPDIIFFFGGTNDGKFSTLGTFDETAEYSTVDLESTTWSTFVDAYVTAIMRLQYYYPNAAIFTMTPMFVASWYTNGTLSKYCEQIKKISNYFGVTCVDMRKCGIKTTNLAKFLKDGLHPTKAGMYAMAEYVISQVEPILANFVSVGATEPEVDTLTKLSSPTVTISNTGLASWGAVANATKYAYSIDGANAVETTELSVQLTDGQSIKVKAVGDSTTYADSDFSAVATYTTNTDDGEEPETPDYEVPTETVWYVDFTNEKGNFNYANGGGAAAFSQPATYNKCVGVPINAVKLMVGNNGAIGYGRVAADGDTYTHLGTIELTGASAAGTDATPQAFKLEETIVLGEGERLAIMEYGGGLPGKIWVSTQSSTDAAKVRTNIRSMSASKDETWKLLIGIGYVVD